MEGVLRNKNGKMFQSKATLPDGTIEITDTLPKQDYYKSLRRNSVSSPGSQFTINNGINVYDATSGYKKSKAIDYKPSGKQVQCLVLMLEGVEQIFVIDKNFYGLHLFKMICEKLELTEIEYLGLTFRGNQNVDMWLKMDERIAKQLEKNPWKFEFRFKYYPARPEYLTDGLTRYFLCLQIRQDIICGQLPCSFNTYVILGAYIIQSEAGDWDPEVHQGIEYLNNVPFAPKNLQTPEMLTRIAELHQKLKGRTPEQADLMFLENARRLALYGVHLHRVKDLAGEDLSLGVYHSGILIYRGRLRKRRYTWARIVELSYKGKDFIMVVRPSLFDDFNETPYGSTKRQASVSSTKNNTSGNSSLLTERGTAKQRSRSAKPPSASQSNRTLTFKCLNGELAKRLYNVVVDHHTFFRLRDGASSKRLNLQPAFGTRKYHYNNRSQILDDSESGMWTLNREADLPPQASSIHRVAAQRKPDQYAKSLVTLMTPVATHKGFRAPCASIEDTDSIRNGFRETVNTIGPHESSVLMEESYAPVKDSQPVISVTTPSATKMSPGWAPVFERPPQQVSQMSPPPNVKPCIPRPELSRHHWQMSPADCTQGLGMDLCGTDVATMMDAGWQGSRTNRGIKGPGSYYYEVGVLEDGDIRVGWSANDASLMLGMDAHGYGYGAAENGDGSTVKHSEMGRLVYNGNDYAMGFPAAVSDVIGCFLQVHPDPSGNGLEGNVMWSHNGQLVTSPQAELVRIPPELATDKAFFPTVSLRDARIALNFGDKPFVHSPEQISGGRVKWTAPVNVSAEQLVQNVNSGWRINQFDTTSTINLIVSEDGRMIQANNNEWQGFRANKGVYEAGKYYYEVEKVEDCGYLRVGWSLPSASLQLGADNLGYGFGCAPDGSPAKKVFNGEVEDYGLNVKVGDVVGCFLDLDNGEIQWSVNGEVMPRAYHMDCSFITHDKTIFYPSASLFCTTLEVNYGDRPFKYQPSEEWYPLFAAADEFVQDSPKWPLDINAVRKPHATTERVESDILYPEVTITVPSREQRACTPGLEQTNVRHRISDRASTEGEDEEDTVIDVRDDQEKGPSQSSASTTHQTANDIPFTCTRTAAQTVTRNDDPEEIVECYTNHEGQRVKKIIQKQRQVVTTIRKESVERFETTHVHHCANDSESGWQHSTGKSNVNEDEALNKAIHEATKLDCNTFVIKGSNNILSDVIPTSSATANEKAAN